jgi:hypothetical protein
MIALACRDAAGVPGVYRLGSRLGAHQENMRFIGVFVEVCQLNRSHFRTPRILFLVGERDKAMIDSGAMPAKKKASKPEQDAYSVGDRLQVRLSAGRIVEATVKAVIERTDGKRQQVDLRTRPHSFISGR